MSVFPMRYAGSRVAATYVACLSFLLAFSSAKAFACPCEYRADKFPELTSKSPLPTAHVVCLAPIHDLLVYLRAAAKKARSDKARNAHQTNSERILKIDWGVPPPAVVRNMIQDAESNIAESKRTLGLEKRKLGDPDHIQEIVLDNIGLDESTIQHGTKIIEYAQCVRKNNLPPTTSGKE